MVQADLSIFDFWMRSGGASTKLFKLKRSDRLPPGELIVASLLCRDRIRFKSCAHLLKAHRDEFFELLFKYSLTSIVFHELNIRGAASIFKDLNEEALFSKVTEELRHRSATESMAYQYFDGQLTKFISGIGKLNDDLI
jgi:hypothetical protein